MKVLLGQNQQFVTTEEKGQLSKTIPDGGFLNTIVHLLHLYPAVPSCQCMAAPITSVQLASLLEASR